MNTARPDKKNPASDTQAPNVLYDGRALCHEQGCCPLVESLPGGRVRVYDPAKPENGAFTCTTEEYNNILAHAKRAEV